MRFGSLTRLGRMAAAGAAVVVAGATIGVATARIPAEDGRIFACYKKSGGALRVIDEFAKCRNDETTLYWSESGPQGLPGDEGPMGPMGPEGPAGPALGWYADGDWTIAGNPVMASSFTTILSLDLPEVQPGQGYLGSATFTLVNEGPNDADAVCNLGNQMGHELFLPVNEVTDPSQGGVWGSNARTYTLTGMSDFGGMQLACTLTNWQGEPSADPPEVNVRRASISATFIDQLEDQSQI